MRKNLLALLASVLAVACSSKQSPTAPVDPTVLPSMQVMVAEKAMGSTTAPNTIIEYSSFTCPHCADFHTLTMPELKAKYVDTNLVRFVFRNSPRDTGADLTAAMLARCAGDRYFDAVTTLFTNQAAWAGAGDPIGALGNVMRNFGMSQAVIDACRASTELRDAILKMKQEGVQRYNYPGVPAFIINETTMLIGDRPLAEFEPYLVH